ncbi:MAG: DNA sulfur modification protein DndB, partial [Terriglobia bacterium]
MTAHDIHQLYKTGFLKVDPDRQRGMDSVTNKRILDEEKVEKWAEQLVKDEAYLGQLSWNFRKGETTLEYDEASRSLKIGAGAATIPDSGHRHMAILKAAESVAKGSSFRLDRKVSVRIYNAPASEENRIFYAMNQEGKKADPTRSKWLHRLGATKIAGALAEQCPSFKDNVDTIRDRLSKKNPRLCAFNTLSVAFETYWSDCNPEDEAAFNTDVAYAVQFWNKLASVRPELGKLD